MKKSLTVEERREFYKKVTETLALIFTQHGEF